MMLHPGTLYDSCVEYLNVLSVVFVCACALPSLIISYRDLVVLFDANVVVNFIQDDGHVFMCTHLWTSYTRIVKLFNMF